MLCLVNMHLIVTQMIHYLFLALSLTYISNAPKKGKTTEQTSCSLKYKGGSMNTGQG